MVEFASNGDTARGYLARPASGSGPGVLVLQEWWGLVPQLKGVCDRLAGEGFVALAPDLYRGEIARAHRNGQGRAADDHAADGSRRARHGFGRRLPPRPRRDARATRSASSASAWAGCSRCSSRHSRATRSARRRPIYGAPLGDSEPDWSNLSAPVRGHFAENDDFFPPEAIKDLEARLRAAGKDVDFEVHAGTGHAFANEENPLGTHDAGTADKCWGGTLAFLHAQLG